MRLQTDFFPSILDSALDARPLLTCNVDCFPGKIGELTRTNETLRESFIPDRANDLPRLAANGSGSEIKAWLGIPELMCTPPLSVGP